MYLTNRLSLVMEAAGGAGGSGGAGAAGGTGATGTGGDAGGSGAGGGAAPFYSTFTDPDLRGFAENKKFESPEALTKSYRELEKLRGLPPERLLTVPADDKPESWAPVYDRLGRPKEAKDYAIKVPQGAPQEYAGQVAKVLHDLGLSKKQGEGVAAYLANTADAGTKSQGEAAQRQVQEQIASLKTEWGAATEGNAKIVDQMVAALGLTEAQTTAMEKAIGFDGFSKLMVNVVSKFGIKLGEASFHGGDSNASSFGQMSPEAAKAKREELLSDADFYKKWRGGDKAAMKQVDETYRLQYVNGI